jgi:hypothetical protein
MLYFDKFKYLRIVTYKELPWKYGETQSRDYKQHCVLPRVVHFEPKQKAEKFYQVCNLFVTLFLIVYMLLPVK